MAQFLVKIIVMLFVTVIMYFKQFQVTYQRCSVQFTIAVPSGIIFAWFWGFLMMTCQPSRKSSLMTQMTACVRVLTAGWGETMTPRSMVDQPGGGWWMLLPILLVVITTPLLWILLRNTKVSYTTSTILWRLDMNIVYEVIYTHQWLSRCVCVYWMWVYKTISSIPKYSPTSIIRTSIISTLHHPNSKACQSTVKVNYKMQSTCPIWACTVECCTAAVHAEMSPSLLKCCG